MTPNSIYWNFSRYKKNELGLRTALLYCGNSISNAFGSLIASGILGSLDGTLGFSAWRSELKCPCFQKTNCSDFSAAGGSSLWRALWLSWSQCLQSGFYPIFLRRRTSGFRLMNRYWQNDAWRKKLRPLSMKASPKGTSLVLSRLLWIGGYGGLVLLFISWIARSHSLCFSRHYPLQWVTTQLQAFCSAHLRGFWELQPHLLWRGQYLLHKSDRWINVTEWRHSDTTGDRFWHIVGPLLLSIIGFTIAISTMNMGMRYLSLFEPSSLCSVIPRTYVLHADSLWLRAQPPLLSLWPGSWIHFPNRSRNALQLSH